MNKAQLRARTRMLAGAELDGLRSDPEVDQLVEEAYHQVGSLLSWKWREDAKTIAVAADQENVDLGALGIAEPQTVAVLGVTSHTLPVQLQEVTIRDLLTRLDRDGRGLPRFYARTGQHKLRLGPVPDKEYTVEVFGLVPLQGLPDDASVPEWDPQFHAIIAYLAAAVFLDEEGQEELAAKRRDRSQELLGDMVDFYQISKDRTPFVIGGGRGGWPQEGLYPWRG